MPLHEDSQEFGGPRPEADSADSGRGLLSGCRHTARSVVRFTGRLVLPPYDVVRAGCITPCG